MTTNKTENRNIKKTNKFAWSSSAFFFTMYQYNAE